MGDYDNDRYVPRATSNRPGQWYVYDRKLDRFCTPEEVAKLTPETVNEKLPVN